jgi:hypothetical protein
MKARILVEPAAIKARHSMKADRPLLSMLILLWWFVFSAGGTFVLVEARAADMLAVTNPSAARQSVRLLRSPEIQNELGLDAAQVEAIAAAVEKVDLP